MSTNDPRRTLLKVGLGECVVEDDESNDHGLHDNSVVRVTGVSRAVPQETRHHGRRSASVCKSTNRHTQRSFQVGYGNVVGTVYG